MLGSWISTASYLENPAVQTRPGDADGSIQTFVLSTPCWLQGPRSTVHSLARSQTRAAGSHERGRRIHNQRRQNPGIGKQNRRGNRHIAGFSPLAG